MTTDFRALCAELVRIADAFDSGAPLVSNQGQALDGYSALAAFRAVAVRARAALAEPEPEVYYEFTVLNDEYCTEAGGTAPTLSQAIDEGRHYFAQYSQDGQYTLQVHRVEVIPVPS